MKVANLSRVWTSKKKFLIICIDKYSKDNTDYAIRFVYEIDEKKYDIENNNYFVFTFCAYHFFKRYGNKVPFSNILGLKLIKEIINVSRIEK